MKIAQIIYANTWGDVTPKAFEKGIGGREGALIRLAKEWAALGHEVTNFVPVQKATRFEGSPRFDLAISEWQHAKDLENWEPKGRFGPPDATPALYDPRIPRGFHEYVPVALGKHMLASFPYDAVVSWEAPEVFAKEDIREKQKVRLIHMQVAHMEDMDYAEEYSTGIVALSPWARDFLKHSGLNHDNMYVRPNGVNIDDYPLKPRSKDPRDRPSFVYSSSPDRGLWHLLKVWPRIRKEYRGATLYVAYGVKDYLEYHIWLHNRVGEMSVEIANLLDQQGVVDVGKIGQKQLAKLQMNASAWLYPADTIQATETGCITAIENMAAGNPCFMNDSDCLKSEFNDVAVVLPLPFNEDEYLHSLFSYMEFPEIHKALADKGRSFAETRDWSLIAPTWIDLFKENKNGQS